MDLDKFSVVSTIIEYNQLNNTIIKKYKKNVDIPITTVELKNLIDKYLLSLKDIGIPIPNVIKSYIENQFVVYEIDYCGQNIIELGFDILKFDDFKNHIIKMLTLLKKVINSNIYFDPHPKNFVFNDKNEIFYVDFFPPYTDSLKKLRLSVANKDEVEIIKKNYSFLTGEFLAEHFCGDFLNIDKNSESIFDKIYILEKAMGISLRNQKTFIEKANYIRSIEDLRLAKNIYLL